MSLVHQVLHRSGSATSALWSVRGGLPEQASLGGSQLNRGPAPAKAAAKVGKAQSRESLSRDKHRRNVLWHLRWALVQTSARC